MRYIAAWLILIADWFDNQLLKHRFYYACNLIGTSDWWDYLNTDAALEKLPQGLDFELTSEPDGWQATIFELIGDTVECHEHKPFRGNDKYAARAIGKAINAHKLWRDQQ